MDSIRVQPMAPSDAQQIVEFMKIDFLKVNSMAVKTFPIRHKNLLIYLLPE